MGILKQKILETNNSAHQQYDLEDDHSDFSDNHSLQKIG